MTKVKWFLLMGIVLALVVLWAWAVTNAITNALNPTNIGHFVKSVKDASK